MGNGNRMSIVEAEELISKAAFDDARYPEACFVTAEATLLSAQKRIALALAELQQEQTILAGELADRAKGDTETAARFLAKGNAVEWRHAADQREKNDG